MVDILIYYCSTVESGCDTEIRNIGEIDGKLGWICLKDPVCN